MQPEGGVPKGIGAPPDSSQAFGAQCDNKVLIDELDKKNISPLSIHARQAFTCLKQNFEKPHVVVPHHCIFDAPNEINVYTDGNWKNPYSRLRVSFGPFIYVSRTSQGGIS